MTLATRVVGQRQRACRKLRPCERKERKLLSRDQLELEHYY